jgi:hypothetical protein
MSFSEEYKQQLIVRLNINKVIDANTGCWIWNRYKTEKGYGVTKVHGKTRKVHRLSYELFVKPLKEGAIVHHKCANTTCFNPDHLQATSHIQNSAEMNQRQWYIKRIKELEGELKLLKD